MTHIRTHIQRGEDTVAAEDHGWTHIRTHIKTHIRTHIQWGKDTVAAEDRGCVQGLGFRV